MTGTFYEQPILNSPYEEPALHHALDEEGQPTDNPPIAGRRSSKLISPVPKPRKRREKADPKQVKMGAYTSGLTGALIADRLSSTHEGGMTVAKDSKPAQPPKTPVKPPPPTVADIIPVKRSE